MSSRIAAFAAIVACTAATEEFLWKPTSKWSDTSNWEGNAVPTGTIDLTQGCIDEFGSDGGTIYFDSSVNVGEILLPNDGSIVLEEGSTMTLTGSTQDSGSWRCKSALEMNSACGKNYMKKDDTGAWVQSDTAPCYNDVVKIQNPTMIHWDAGQFLRSVEITMDGQTKLYRSTTDLDAVDAANPGMFQGTVPIINDVTACGNDVICQAMCMDKCPQLSLELGSQNRTKFFELSATDQDKIIEQTRQDQDNLNDIRDDVDKDFKKGSAQLKLAAEKVQQDYEKKMADEGYTLVQGQGSVVIPELTVTPASMANWMTSAGVGDAHQVHYIKNSITKQTAIDAIDFFNDVRLGNKDYGFENNQPMGLDDQLWTAIDTRGFVRGGRLQRAVYSSVEKFVIADANKILGDSTQSKALIISFIGPVGVAADVTLDFDTALGAFKVTNVEVSDSSHFVDGDGNKAPATDPRIFENALSATLVRMALFARADALSKEIHFRPTTTLPPTTSPTTSPTSSPTKAPTLSPTMSPTAASAAFMEENLPVVAGGAGGLLLIIIIIVVLCVVLGGSKKDSKEDSSRNVVAFQNPMYDDPAADGGNNTNAAANGDGLYDEPTFNQNDDKENPMYQSNDDVAGGGDGYLDVQPDDEDEDDEDEEAVYDDADEEDDEDDDE